MEEKKSIKDYVSENSAIINDLKTIIDNMASFIVNDNKNQESTSTPEVNCLVSELSKQNDDLKTIIEKASKILNILR